MIQALTCFLKIPRMSYLGVCIQLQQQGKFQFHHIEEHVRFPFISHISARNGYSPDDLIIKDPLLHHRTSITPDASRNTHLIGVLCSTTTALQ